MQKLLSRAASYQPAKDDGPIQRKSPSARGVSQRIVPPAHRFVGEKECSWQHQVRSTAGAIRPVPHGQSRCSFNRRGRRLHNPANSEPSTGPHGDLTMRRHVLAALGTLPWWAPALNAYAQSALPSLPPLDERVRGIKVERGGLSLDIPTIAETGTSVPVVLFVDPATLRGRTVARLGILAPLNPRPVALEIELGPVLSQPRLTTSIRLGATQTVIGVAQLSDGTLWQHSINVLLTGTACFDGT